MKVRCRLGYHVWVSQPSKIVGRLVIHTKKCELCGVRKGKVEKL